MRRMLLETAAALVVVGALWAMEELRDSTSATRLLLADRAERARESLRDAWVGFQAARILNHEKEI